MAVDSRNRSTVNDGNDDGVRRSNSIEDMEQRANYVRGHKRELKCHKETKGFYCRAT